ncbi:MAG: LPS export ABC transporter permease LptF [Alphaproteobacteria bacterium]|nr:LPS export ABC transporter permease LptF [Alphaproteobacteria bacterium]
MPRFDRYMLSQLLVIFGFSSIVLVLVYWVNRAVRLFDFLIGSGQSAAVFLEFTALSLPNVIRLVLPVSAFAAAVYVTNRLSSESELVVVQSTGYSPYRLARPVLVFGILVALFIAALVHFAVPASHGRLVDRQAEVSENVTARLLVEGRFMHPAPGATLYIREISPTGELRDLFLRDARRDDRHVTYTATRALLLRSDEGPRLAMFDGMAQTLDPKLRSLSVTRFEALNLDVGRLIDMDAGGGAERRSYRELSTAELLSGDPEIAREVRLQPAAMVVEGHQRFTQSLMAIAAPLIGFAALMLGGFSRFGVWNQIFGAIALIVLLQTLDNAVADATLSNPELWPMVYAPSLIGMLAALLMLWMAAHRGIVRRRLKPGVRAR